MVVLEHVWFAFHITPVLRDISLAVEPGERVGVLGPNGSGKSTLLRIINGILTPQRGQVSIAGQDIRTLRRQQVARLIAVVPQEHQVTFPFSVEEIVLMGRTPYLRGWPFANPADQSIVQWALECTGTRQLAAVPFLQLSSGEKQRVIVARAIAQQPKILLLDEFTASLDVRYQLELHALVDQLCLEQKLAVIAVSHDLNLAVQHCDRLLLLDRGAVVALGEPTAVLQPHYIRQVFGVNAVIDIDPATRRMHVAIEPLNGRVP